MSGALTSNVILGTNAYRHFRCPHASLQFGPEETRAAQSSHHAAILSAHLSSTIRPPAPHPVLNSHWGTPAGDSRLSSLPTASSRYRTGGLARRRPRTPGPPTATWNISCSVRPCSRLRTSIHPGEHILQGTSSM
ncbi:Hypothetical predicted protein [Pelobates cultripes]|uniref:Uncharacterized protein n=1 Tax=Pelobates cultripes TaxID=61616 RepID=A0AAD1SK05_PELCU|nr:Hypothetical predicted protein [Pelobates cultripes]